MLELLELYLQFEKLLHQTKLSDLKTLDNEFEEITTVEIPLQVSRLCQKYTSSITDPGTILIMCLVTKAFFLYC